MNSVVHMMKLSARLQESLGNTYLAMYLNQQGSALDRIMGGKRYIAATFYVPGELCRIFDAEVVYSERLSGFVSACKMLDNPGYASSIHGMPDCACSYQVVFDYLLRQKVIPLPDLLIALDFACDDAWLYYRMASKKRKIPFCFIDSGKDEELLGRQLVQLHERLRERYSVIRSVEDIVDISNKTMDLKAEIDEMRLEYPGILDSSDGFKLFTLYNDLGSTSAYDVLQDLKVKLSKRRTTYRDLEGCKILWLGLVPLYDNNLISRMEKKYHCRVVYEEMFDFTHKRLTVSNFFYDLANRIVSSNFFSVANRLKNALNYARLLEVDGIVHFSQRNCNFLPSMLPLMRREFDKARIPFIDVSGDVINPAYFDEERFWNVLDAFFESINWRL